MKLKNEKSIFIELSEFIAKAQADQLEAKQKLLMPKEQYVKQKTLELVHNLEDEHKKTLLYMEKAKHLLTENIENLPDKEKEHHARELLTAMDKLSCDIKMGEVIAATSWQKFLGFSNETLLWIYKLGYQFYEEKNNKDAHSLFLLLPMLNPLVCDYWTALGFAQKGLSLELEALNSFFTASFLNPDNPTPRYQIAKIHLHLGQFDEVLLELEDLAKIVEAQNLTSLQPQVEILQNKAKNKQSI